MATGWTGVPGVCALQLAATLPTGDKHGDAPRPNLVATKSVLERATGQWWKTAQYLFAQVIFCT